MRASILILLLSLTIGAPLTGHAQAEGDAGPARTRTRVVRPPEGSLRRGAWPVPGWVAYVAGGAILAGAAGALAYRIRKRRR